MRAKPSCRIKLNNRAFTLYELLISLTLFLLVGSVVIGFISYVSRFNATNAEQTQLFKNITDVREEIDFWISAFDSSEYRLEIPDPKDLPLSVRGTGTLIVAKKLDGAESSEAYTISLDEKVQDGKTVTVAAFSYPITFNNYHDVPESGVIEIECPRIDKIFFYSQGDGQEDLPVYDELGSNARVLSFLCVARITDTVYGCDIIYS